MCRDAIHRVLPWEDHKLPPPECGETGLRMLQALEQRRTGLALNYRGDWQNQVDHLLAQG